MIIPILIFIILCVLCFKSTIFEIITSISDKRIGNIKHLNYKTILGEFFAGMIIFIVLFIITNLLLLDITMNIMTVMDKQDVKIDKTKLIPFSELAVTDDNNIVATLDYVGKELSIMYVESEENEKVISHIPYDKTDVIFTNNKDDAYLYTYKKVYASTINDWLPVHALDSINTEETDSSLYKIYIPEHGLRCEIPDGISLK